MKNNRETITEKQAERMFIGILSTNQPMYDGSIQDSHNAYVTLRNGEKRPVNQLEPMSKESRAANGDYQLNVSEHNHGGDDMGKAWVWGTDDGVVHYAAIYALTEQGKKYIALAEDGAGKLSSEIYVDFVDGENMDENGKFLSYEITGLSPVSVGNDVGTQIESSRKVSKQTKEEEMGKVEAIERLKNATDGTATISDVIAALQKLGLDDSSPDFLDVVKDVLGAVTGKGSDADTSVEPEDGEDIILGNEKKNERIMAENNIPAQHPMTTNAVADTKENQARINSSFSRIVAENRGRGWNDIANAVNTWKKTNGITGADVLPKQLQGVFFKAWTDNDSALSAFSIVNQNGAFPVYSFESESTAMGHKKATTKVDQDVTLERRDLLPLLVYKKLPIDMQDLLDDSTGELMRFRSAELASRVANQIIVAALLGGQQQGSVKNTTTGTVRGLYGVADDANATTGFGTKVATKVTGVATDNPYDMAVKTLGVIRTTAGQTKSLFVYQGWRTELLTSKDANNGYLFPPSGGSIESLLGVDRIVEMDELVDGKQVFALRTGGYVLTGSNSPIIRTDFDTTVNQDVLLLERFTAGSLQDYMAAGMYVAAAE